MNVYIIHDSDKGNGKLLAERLEAEFKALGAETVVGHRTEISPEQVAEAKPDLLIIGAAVRKFMMSPPVKRWISLLNKKLQSSNATIQYSALFLTHMMPDSMVEGRVERLKRHIIEPGSIANVYAEWFSGQVKAMPGPFIDGVMEKTPKFAEDLKTWAQPR